MRSDILDYLRGELRRRCEQPSNRFGMGVYGHIEAVVKNGALLAERYGAEMARVILPQWDYEPEKITLVQNCIRSHRGSVPLDRKSGEELCVADADAVSHFDSLPSLLYLACRERGMGFEEGKRFVKEKLERSFQKLSPRSRELYRNKYRRVMDILNG